MGYIILSFGGGEMLLVFLVFLLLFGANKMPELAKGLGKGLKEFKRATDDIKRELSESTGGITQEISDTTSDIRRNIGEITSNITREVDTHTADIKREVETQTADIKKDSSEIASNLNN
jgi:sec-independent protein translocase protein TatA